MSTYRIVVDGSGKFAVQIETEGRTKTVDGFETEREANDWMVARQGSGGSANDAELGDMARQQLAKAAAGNADAARTIEQIRTADPAAADAAEQEASDGPPGLGLAR